MRPVGYLKMHFTRPSLRRRWTLAHSTAALWLAVTATVDAENWSEFRGPTGQGRSTATGLPVHWSPHENVAWRTPIAGKGWSSPILWGERVFLTTAVELESAGSEAVDQGATDELPSVAAKNADQSLRCVCLDAATGNVLWDVEALRTDAVNLPSSHAKNSYASPTPITDGRHVFVHFGPLGTAALDFDGNVLWANQSIKYNAQHGGGGSPILCAQALIFNCDGVEDPFVVALDKSNGHELWRSPRPQMDPQRFAFSTPLAIEAGGREQVISPGSHMVGSYDPDTGRELWRVHFPNKWSVVPRPVFVGGLILVCTGYEGPAELLAIRPDGQGDVTDTHVVWRSKKFVPHTSSPVVAGDAIYMVSDEGVAACTDAASGELRWRKRVGGNFSASLLLADGRIYLPDERGVCLVIEAGGEFRQLAKNDLQEPTFASYAVGEGALFVRTAEALYRIEAAVDAADGE